MRELGVLYISLAPGRVITWTAYDWCGRQAVSVRAFCALVGSDIGIFFFLALHTPEFLSALNSRSLSWGVLRRSLALFQFLSDSLLRLR